MIDIAMQTTAEVGGAGMPQVQTKETTLATVRTFVAVEPGWLPLIRGDKIEVTISINICDGNTACDLGSPMPIAAAKS